MIELSQPVQCLFCPQRRKIALLMKLVLAGSTAIIVGLILFQPGSGRVGTPRSGAAPREIAPVVNPGVQVFAQGQPGAERGVANDAISARSAEIRAQARERFEAVQSQIRPLLQEKTLPVERAQKLLDERRKEVLRAKVLALGEQLFSGSAAAEAERKAVLEALNKELTILADQKELLAELKGTK